MPRPDNLFLSCGPVNALSRVNLSMTRAGESAPWYLVFGIVFILALGVVFPFGNLPMSPHHGSTGATRSSTPEFGFDPEGGKTGSVPRSLQLSSTQRESSWDGASGPPTASTGQAGVSARSSSQFRGASDPTNYSVIFSESGLPTGTEWWTNVTSNGTTFNSTSDAISFLEPNATYDYTVASANKMFAPATPSGKFTVDGNSVAAANTFRLVTYPVNFTETGLPASTVWSIHINGTNSSSDTDQILVLLPNGSYPYHINQIPGERASGPNGYANVSGSPVNVSVKFTVAKYAIEFTETGLAANTTWQLILTPSSGLPISANSSTTFIKFFEPNGTYHYSFSPVPGYRIKGGSPTGTVTVAGSIPPPIPLHWTNTALPTKKGAPILEYLIIGSVAAVGAFLVVLLLIRHRRKARRVPSPPPSAAEEQPHAPGPALLENRAPSREPGTTEPALLDEGRPPPSA